MVKSKFIIFLLFFLFICLIPSTFALGIAPSRVILNFEPNLERTIQYYITNRGAQAEDVEILVSGALEDYITVSKTTEYVRPGEIKSFEVHIKLPERIETPGRHETIVWVREKLPENTEGMGLVARLNVGGQIWMDVPYPGKYGEIVSFEANNAKIGEDVNFTIVVRNKGKEPINLRGTITVYEGNNPITTLDTNTLHLQPNEDGFLKATLKTDNLHYGTYRANALVEYEGATRTAETTFKIGTLLVKINDILFDTIETDKIAKFKLILESMWNEKIDNIFAELLVLNKEKIISTAKSETISLQPWEAKNITIYWEAKDVTPGNYIAKFILHYSNQTTEKIIPIKIVSPWSGTWIYIIVVIGGGSVGFVIYRKRKRKSSKKY